MTAGILTIRDLLTGGASRGTLTTLPGAGTAPAEEEAIIQQPELAALYQFWVNKKTSLGKIPARKDFEPVELAKLLPNIALVDVDTHGPAPEFTFRLCGTQIVEDCGADLTGKTWSDFPNSEDIVRRARKLVESLEPYYANNIQAKWAPKSFHHYSVLALPLSDDGLTVNMILAGMVFHPYTK